MKQSDQWDLLTEVDPIIAAIKAGRHVEFTGNPGDTLDAPRYDPYNYASGGWIPFTYTDRIPLRRLLNEPHNRFRVLK